MKYWAVYSCGDDYPLQLHSCPESAQEYLINSPHWEDVEFQIIDIPNKLLKRRDYADRTDNENKILDGDKIH